MGICVVTYGERSNDLSEIHQAPFKILPTEAANGQDVREISSVGLWLTETQFLAGAAIQQVKSI